MSFFWLQVIVFVESWKWSYWSGLLGIISSCNCGLKFPQNIRFLAAGFSICWVLKVIILVRFLRNYLHLWFWLTISPKCPLSGRRVYHVEPWKWPYWLVSLEFFADGRVAKPILTWPIETQQCALNWKVWSHTGQAAKPYLIQPMETLQGAVMWGGWS